MTNPTVQSKQKKSNKILMEGKKFGRWTVLEEAGRSNYRTVMWKCLCSCGTVRDVSGGDLRSGRSVSCGCFKMDKITKHGMYKTAIYKTWTGMLTRCNNPKDDNYKNYGGRGITVCERWLKFENFFEDMGIKPKGLTIERMDNNGNYEIDNCCWATQMAQSRNQRIQKNNKTGVAGIFWHKEKKKFRVDIKVNYKNHFIGYFNTIELAKVARLNAELKYWGRQIMR